jgi:asparagine synthase (glutamine-hydrolysing)
MCGIAGIVHTDRRPVDADALRRMMVSLAHRGPDGDGTWTNGQIGLAHTRLAIIELHGGRQPMVSPETGCVLTYNGEVYNYRALRRALASEGLAFRDASDTEVVLRAYEHWGDGCVDHLSGMFAFAVWDPRTRRLFAARDRLGIKPFYYRWDGATLTFASELRAVLEAQPSSARQLDTRSFDAYLRLQYVPGPHTMVLGVSQLPAGSTMSLAIDAAQLSTTRYWRPRPRRGPATTAAELQVRLSAAVESHMVADVPVGALLSGGIDSSLIVAHMVRAASAKVHTFSVGFDDDQLDERAAARRVSSHLGTIHHEQVVTAGDAGEALPRVVASMDQPLADYAALPTYLIARFASQHVKVVLTGEGADELFGGYRRYRRDLLLSPLQAFRRRYQPSHVFSDREAALLTRRSPAPLGQDHRAGSDDDADPLNRMLARDLEGWLADDLLVKVDRMTMRCSLEARVPYLDHEFVEYALGIPQRDKVRPLSGVNKIIMREGARAMIPPAIAARPKHGFKPPLDAWLRGPLRCFAADTLLAASARIRQQVDARHIARLLAGLDRGRPTGHRIWALLVHELWSRERGVA